ncbi:MAG: hypothetical protein K0U72_11905 [Gammaproteobacteria bacterium]|nr:hypothetical protein [Gammaproteobacteria bacterium]
MIELFGFQRTKTQPFFLVTLVTMLLASIPAQAQETLSNSEFTPDHASIYADKVQPPGTLLYPTEPMSPDPMISTLPPGADYRAEYWKKMRKMKARAATQARSSAAAARSSTQRSAVPDGPIDYTEEEIEKGANDVQADAEKIRQFGTGRNENNQVIINGSLGSLDIRPLAQVEDDGAIPLALPSGIVGGPDGISFSGVIGDGPMAGTVSDYDFVEVFVPAGTTFDIAVRTPDPFGDLDPFVTFYLPDGTIIFQQDDGGDGFDTFVSLTVGANDLSFLMAIGGFGAFEPADPFNSEGGSVTGLIGSEGSYEFEMRVFPPGEGDVDFYTVNLDKGDVLGAAVRNEGTPVIGIFNVSESLEKGVAGFGSFGVSESPLPIDGNTTIDYIVEESGKYAIALGGSFGGYELELGVYRPEFEREKNRIQLIWLDYNGGPVNKEPWFGFPVITDHTPFRDFLPAWDLPNRDRDVRRITRKITHEVRDNLGRELARSRENRNFGVVVLGNDGTGHWDWFDQFIEEGSFTIFGLTFEISVVEVSGTIEESFINTIGIASTIDPGNYAVNDTALVLLDVLSAPASGISGEFTFSLNDVELAPGVTKKELVTTVLGNVIAHEAGHYIGNFHTDGFNPQQNIMDEGPGGLFNLAGIGESGIFGANDQLDVGFFDDLYSVREGFEGDENTTVNTAFGLSYFKKH